MATITEKNKMSNTYKINKVTNKKKIEMYSNDEYFLKKNKQASDFLKKTGLPENLKAKKK
jgi:hypothetical protein